MGEPTKFLLSVTLLIGIAARGILRLCLHLASKCQLKCPGCRRPLEPSGFGGGKMRCPCCEKHYTLLDKEGK